MSNPQKRKGDKWENHVLKLLQEIDPTAKRKKQSGRYDTKEPDVETRFWCIECKHQKTLNWFAAIRQAMRRRKKVKTWAVAARLTGFFPAHHEDGKLVGAKPLDVVVIPMEAFESIMRCEEIEQQDAAAYPAGGS